MALGKWFPTLWRNMSLYSIMKDPWRIFTSFCIDLETAKKKSKFIRNLRNHLYSKTFSITVLYKPPNLQDGFFSKKKKLFYWIYTTENVGPSGRAVWGVGLRPMACWDRGFKSHRGHGYLSVVSVVCCQVEVSATSWSLVQRSPTDCAASCVT